MVGEGSSFLLLEHVLCCSQDLQVVKAKTPKDGKFEAPVLSKSQLVSEVLLFRKGDLFCFLSIVLHFLTLYLWSQTQEARTRISWVRPKKSRCSSLCFCQMRGPLMQLGVLDRWQGAIPASSQQELHCFWVKLCTSIRFYTCIILFLKTLMLEWGCPSWERQLSGK